MEVYFQWIIGLILINILNNLMDRPRRLSGQQCIELIQQLAADASGEDSETSGDSLYELHPTAANDSTQSVSSEEEERNQPAVSTSSTINCCQVGIEDSVVANGPRGRGRGRGQRRGRGNGVRLSHSDPVSDGTRISISETGRDGTIWCETSIGNGAAGRRARQNVFKNKPGPTAYACQRVKEGSAVSAFSLIIDEPMLRHVQRCTQEEARRQLQDNSWSISLEEIEAFIAILYVRGASGARTLPLKSLWSSEWGLPFCKTSMTRSRFSEVMKFLRFDMKSTRSQRIVNDKFALASEIWNRFIVNSKMCFIPGENITVDEQLFPTKARCRWTQYMANKPDKFGIKFWLAADVDTKYLVNGFPYLGKDESHPPGQTLSESVVLRLMEPYLGKGHNVTTDNFFTSMKLMKKLQENQTSLVGTMNRSRRELPPSTADTSDELYSTRLLKHDNFTLTVYRCKRSKNVLMMSSLHSCVSVGNDQKKIPETVAFYNSTKYGVDVLDQMARKYSVKAGSRRWPVQVWYNILDLAAINSWILYKSITGNQLSRRQFILQLAKELRHSNVHDVDVPQTVNLTAGRKRRQCQVAKCKGNKTPDTCSQCNRAVCGKCTATVQKQLTCIDCSK